MAAHTALLARTRYVRPVPVPTLLSRLRGPATGLVRLPTRLAWSGVRTFDVDEPYWRRRLEEIVLREAAVIGDVEEFVNEDLLRADWGELVLRATSAKPGSPPTPSSPPIQGYAQRTWLGCSPS